MATDIKKQISKVTALRVSLQELEQKLEPLFSKPLQDTLESLDTLQQAKLQVVITYLINDLIFSTQSFQWACVVLFMPILPVYLKTRGIDPKTHAVVSELV